MHTLGPAISFLKKKSILQTSTRPQKNICVYERVRQQLLQLGGKRRKKPPKYPSIAECLNMSVCICSMKFMWLFKSMMWITGFGSVAGNCGCQFPVCIKITWGANEVCGGPRLTEIEKGLELCIFIKSSR